MLSNRILLLFIVLVLFVADGSNASLIHMFLKIKDLSEEISPSPSPAPSSWGPTPEITDERCLVSSKTCHDHNSITACVQFSKTGPKELYLLIQNEGERALKVNVTISHIKIISQELQILEHQTEKIVISKNIGGSSLIVLNAGNGECIIDAGSLAWRHNFSKYLLFVTNLTPISVAYLLFSIAVIIGGTWACCKLKKNKRKFDGVAYEELEMGQPKSLSTRNMDTQGWDEGWDDEWNAEKLSEESSPDR